ncbi:PREDICTED: protein SMG7L-like isoform X2 [Lupinus angustifolius]|uniref:protein SMG7L-like isoform X2 n=1 Tax=Lupinus angustifolius TaxID=3871 RepID=UPI00092F1F82|nr:PREDICTED: protein SMG7L-like isoform X2 [Lupinus angustifolius]
MTTNISLTPGIHEEKVLFEIGNSEKQLWALIHSKGLLHSDAQDLYRKVRSRYERIILNGHTHAELQDVEYSLWKLHYKHIDEFRKLIKKTSGNVESRKAGMTQDGIVQRKNDNHLESFKSFLSQAIEFYQNLIVNLREHHGVSIEALFYKKGWISSSVEADVMLKCQYLCHRCLICIGDLARYKQQCENPDAQNHSWSVAATHYLEATRIWPDSGNPQNQLAVLATYISDEILALYHCVRSLAVKEPFPDAWKNLILLFEKNKSSQLQYVSGEVCFDFLKPSARTREDTEAQIKHVNSNCNKLEGKSNHFTDTKLWPLLVRTISFFFITSSLEEFPIALASTIGELDKMMELEDIELKTMLESYSQMDMVRKGPFRALQVVSIFIFALKNLNNKLENNESNDNNDRQLMQLALAAVFSFMGRFVERCLKASSLNRCPLLPSVLVFVEWYSSMLDAIEVCADDQKSRRAVSYFFDVFVELLNKLNDNGKETEKLLDNTPLWEDYELRGFIPVACSHFSLDFCGNWEHIDNFESGIQLRTERIREAAKKFASISNNLTKWVSCDESGKNIYAPESNDNSTKGEEPNQKTIEDSREHGKGMIDENPSSSSANGRYDVVEEEEVILFRPLTRHNSAPSHVPSIASDDTMSPRDKDDQSLPSDDCLHCATSLLMAQNPCQGDPRELHDDNLNFSSDKPFKQQEHSTKESNKYTFSEAPISVGPPSLNAWVLGRGSFSYNKDNETNGDSKHKLEPIDEIASSSLEGLSINKTEFSDITSVDAGSSNFHSRATHSIPIPSAPLLPDNATWFSDVQSSLPAPLLPHNTSPVSAYSDWSSTYAPHGHDPRFRAFSNGFPPPGIMTSSEWLRWYRENYKPELSNNYMQPTSTHLNATANHENLLYHGNYRFNQIDRWGNPLSSDQYNTYIEPPNPEPLQPNHFNNFQRTSPYWYGVVTDLKNESQSLLEYLKEEECRLRRDPNLRGPTFMGN